MDEGVAIMEYSEIKQIKHMLENVVEDWKTVFYEMQNGTDDFEVEGYRFINIDNPGIIKAISTYNDGIINDYMLFKV